MFPDRLEYPGERKSNHRVQRSFDTFDKPASVLLCGVPSRLVKRIDIGKVASNRICIQRPENHACAIDKTATGHPPSAQEANSGQDLVDSPAETLQHCGGMLQALGFTQNHVVENHDGVGAQHKITGDLRSDGGGLVLGVGQHQCAGGETSGELHDVRRTDNDLKARSRQQIPAPGGSRSQNQTSGCRSLFQRLPGEAS